MFDRYPDYEHLFAQVQLILFMTGMGATLDMADFLRIGRQPRYLIVGAIGQFLLTPLVALAVSTWLGVPDGIAVGLILLSALPGGNLSKAFTYLGHGNVALSISLTCFGMLACLVTVPLLLRFLAADFIPSTFEMPVGEIVLEMVLYLLLPLGVGMAIGRWLPARRQVIARWLIRLGFVFVVAMIVGSIGSGRIHPGEYGSRTALAIILFCLVSMQLSMLPFRLLGWSKPDTLSVGIEVTMRNLNLALLLKAIIFPATVKGDDAIAAGVLFVILFYAGVAFFSGLPLALNFRRWSRREQSGPQAQDRAEAREPLRHSDP
jgi:BASS family bile acid:Na+ symporter